MYIYLHKNTKITFNKKRNKDTSLNYIMHDVKATIQKIRFQ